MSNKVSGGGRLSADQRSALISQMRQTAPISEPAPIAVKKVAPGFDTLPGYEAIRTQRAVADMLGIVDPFYRQHDMRAGARTVVDGQTLINFTSYDYLGLNGHPEITAAVAEAAATWGTSVSASRLTSGERPFHRQLEAELAAIYDCEDALTFVSGHATNISLIAALAGPKDLVVHDSLAHNSIVVGVELSGAHRRLFPHNDLGALDAILTESRDRYERCLIITEGLFSMDGDGPDLAGLVALKNRHAAWLMVDEAHSLGVLGKSGRGLAEHQGVDFNGVDVWMGTLSKTLVSSGGYVTGPTALIEYLKYRASGMVYSVGLAPTVTVAALTAIRLMRREPERVAALARNGQHFLKAARAAGLDVGESWGYAVTPVILGDSLRTVMLAQKLMERGIAAVPIIPPGVPEKSARLRFFLSSAHSAEDIDTAVAITAEELASLTRQGISVAGLAADLAGGDGL